MSSAEKVKILILGDAKGAEKAFGRARRAAEASVKAIGTAGAGAAAAFTAYSVKAATDFQKSISDLSAITGASGKDLDFLRQKALEFGSSTTLSASQASEAFKLIASAKPDLLANGQALAEVTRQAITLAEASGTTMADAANTVGASLNQFGAGAKEAARFVNVLAAGAKFGSSEIEQTSQALKVAGTVASGAGLSFEQTNAAIQLMAKMAIKGSEAGTGLRGVLLKLSNQTNDQFNPRVVGLSKALENLSKANLTSAEKTKLFGLESITAANALINQYALLDPLTKSLTGTATATEQAAVKNANLAGDVKRAQSAMETLAITTGSMLTPALGVLATGLAEVINGATGTAEGLSSSKQAMHDLTITMAQGMDAVGNFAKGIALPFTVAGDAIASVAASIHALVSGGGISEALAIRNAAEQSIINRFTSTTDNANRFENIARQRMSSGSRATGGMIPRDGYYQLHAGERVVSNSQTFGDINITLPSGADAGTDWRSVVRNIIIPELAAAQR